MKKAALSLVLSLILLISLKAQNPQSGSLFTKSLLWKIERNDLPSPSYLFGTVHIIPEKDFIFTDSMKTAFDRCEQLILEIDINIPIFKQLMLAKEMYLPDGKSLADFMAPEDYQNYRTILSDSLGISQKSLNMADHILPVFSSGLFLNELIESPQQYEQFLNKRAKKNKIPVTGLEDIDFQIQIVKEISIEEQIEMLGKPDELMHMEEDYNELIEIYKTQDINELHKLMQDEEMPANIEAKLLNDRNSNWIPLITTHIKSKPSFIAVGAGHLGGEHGLIQLLRREGFKISAVREQTDIKNTQ